MGRPGFSLQRCDVVEFVHVPGPVDLVLHFASPASPVDYLALPLETLKVGSIGTWHALGLAKEKRARFLLASTSEVYGDPRVHPQPEDYWGHVNPVGPRGVYDEAKRYGEALTMAYHRAEGLDTAIVRLFNTYGPRMRRGDGAGGADLRQPGARRRAADRGGRRLVRRARCATCRTPWPGSLALADSDERGPGQHRQPGRALGAVHRRGRASA